MSTTQTDEELSELDELRARLADAEETIRAIRQGEVDALVVAAPHGDRVYTLKTADHPYRLLVEQMHQGAAMLDDDGRVLYCNARFAEIIRQPPDAVITAATVLDFVADQDRPFVQSLIDRARTVASAGEATLRAADQTPVPVYLSLNHFVQPGDSGSICVLVTDLTERRAQEALCGRLHDADRRKDEFLGMLAHELRNPLAVISNASQVLDRIAAPEPQAAKLRGMIMRQTENFTRMVDDLLDISRVTRGKIALQKEIVELSTIVGRAVDGARPLIESREHELVVSLSPHPLRLEADPTRLEQVLVNLLNNAAKYTEPGGRIRLLAEREDDQLVIRVEDSGVGIPPAMLSRIFDLFTQVDVSLTKSHNGLGIGLAMVRSLVELHGGIVTVYSEGTGQGSQFVVRLPALPESQPEPPAPPAPPETSIATRVCVLVVDDHPEVAESICMLLNALGYDSRMVHSGEAALDAVRHERPDLIFIDIGMPEMDGYDVARRLRAQPDLGDLYLVALTGYGQASDRRRARAAGFDTYLVKPAGLKAIEAVLSRTVTEQELSDQDNALF
jgi:PAS domain S-box-containing protein